MIDGTGVGDIGNIVLRDRRVLSEDGIFVVVATIDRKKKRSSPVRRSHHGALSS